MKKPLSIIIIIALLLSLGAYPAFAFGIDPPFRVDGNSATSLANAFEKAAESGSVITQDGKTSDFQELKSGVEVTKNVTLSLGKDDFNANVNRVSYTGTNAPLFTIKNGGVLTIKYSVISGNSNAVNTYGGLIRVEKGGTLILDGTADKPVVISGCKLTASNSKGGAIYCEQGGKVIVKGVTFSGNSAKYGADIYAEQKSDVTIAEGVVVSAAYGESVDISGLNLVLTGEIGLTFHTVVPEKYRDGSFVLTSRTGKTVTCQISECGKDARGRYLATYHLSSLELSEPVTLTVCDKNGDPIAAKTKSAEDYGKALLDDASVTEKEKDVVRTLLNYGHFAQIECAEYEGWELGTDYAETAKYADLTASDSDFEGYPYTLTGEDPSLTQIGIQLDLDYQTEVRLYISSAAKPAVLVNDVAAEVVASELAKYDYCVKIKGIRALDLAEVFTVKVNGKITLTLSAMSYCKLAMTTGSPNNKLAMKALFAFYQATVRYNEG